MRYLNVVFTINDAEKFKEEEYRHLQELLMVRGPADDPNDFPYAVTGMSIHDEIDRVTAIQRAIDDFDDADSAVDQVRDLLRTGDLAEEIAKMEAYIKEIQDEKAGRTVR
jgi:hypothetical protein